MKRFSCVIVDDEPIARDILETFCGHYPMLDVIGLCENAFEAKFLLQEKEVDILFLDINMPELDGISFLKTLKTIPQVILTTAYKEYAIEAFELSVCDYLLKPIALDRFMMAVDKVLAQLSASQDTVSVPKNQPDDFLFVKTEGRIFKVYHHDLLYAEASGKKIKVITSQGVLLTTMTFTLLEESLPSSLFIRVHRSFLVNKSRINYVEGNRIYINANEIAIGEQYRARFLKEIGL